MRIRSRSVGKMPAVRLAPSASQMPSRRRLLSRNRLVPQPPIEDAAKHTDERDRLCFEAVNKARVNWTIHLHQQIHLYLRLTATLQQIGVAAFVSLIGVAIQFPRFRGVLFILSPYLIGLLIMAFMTYLREVFVCAGFMEYYESELARSTGIQVLVTERVLGASPPNQRGSLLADMLNVALFLLSLALSIFYSLSEGWLIVTVNSALLAILVTSIVLSGIEMRGARSHVIQAARQLAESWDSQPEQE